MKSMKQSCIVFFLMLALPAWGKGLSPYLPLNISPEVEAQIEKVFALTPGAPVTKPYKVAELSRRLKQIKDTHPTLVKRLNSYLSRYTQTFSMTNLSGSLSLANNEQKAIPNQRNIKSDSSYQVAVGSLAYINPYLYVSGGVQYADGENAIFNNTHIAFGYEYAQVELGYREHWFSPFQDSAMLVSTHAKASPSITLSNATPITDWNIRYEVFYSKLEKADGIVLGDETFSGRPRHAGLHLSFTPFDFWTLGFNRTLQFGGGKREVSVSDIFQALFDPAGKDNVGDVDTDDPNFEFGNQQASITSKFNLDLGIPVSLYAEYAGEDTVNESNYQLGNVAKSMGIYLPVIGNGISVRYEYSDWTNRWYIHHLYAEGYSNDGQVLGHWGGNERISGNDTPATTHMLNLNWVMDSNQIIDFTARTIKNEDSQVFQYQSAYEINLRYSYATENGFWGAEVYSGKDVFGETFSRLSAFYRW